MTEIPIRLKAGTDQESVIGKLEAKGLPLERLGEVEGEYWTLVFITRLSLIEAMEIEAVKIINGLDEVENCEISLG